MSKKLSAREKRTKEQTQLFNQICSYMRLNQAVTKFGKNKVAWAMNRFVTKQRDLKNLLEKQKKLEGDLAEVKSKIG